MIIIQEGIAVENREVCVVPRRGDSEAWTVEAIDDEGSIEQAIFYGPQAERRAKAYAIAAYGSHHA